jgi:hypothetical protein
MFAPPFSVGNPFLMDSGVILALSTYGGRGNDVIKVAPLQSVSIPLYNCGFCKVVENCRVSFNARLLGTDAIFAASVVTDDDKAGDYLVKFLTPPVVGHYRLELSVRWFRGHDYDNSHFLGAPGRQNFERTPAWEIHERACIVFGSQYLNISVSGTQETTVTADWKIRASLTKKQPFDRGNQQQGMDKMLRCKGLVNNPGYWEHVKSRSTLCSNTSSHPGKCFVLDDVNQEWLWRGYSCQYEFLSPEEVKACFSNASLSVLGDSLTAEFYHNLVDYVPELRGERMFWLSMKQTIDLDILKQVKTPNLYILTNFVLAHHVWHDRLGENSAVVQTIRDDWNSFIRGASNTTNFQAIFATGVPAHFEREKGLTKYRMAQGSSVLRQVAEDLGFVIFDTIPPLESRQDASWDGFHFLQVRDKRGGVSKMLMMMLLNHICLDKKGLP